MGSWGEMQNGEKNLGNMAAKNAYKAGTACGSEVANTLNIVPVSIW